MLNFETSELELASRMGDALLAVANIPVQDERKAAASLIGVGVASLFQQGFTLDQVCEIIDQIIRTYPGLSIQVRRQLMRLVEGGAT